MKKVSEENSYKRKMINLLACRYLAELPLNEESIVFLSLMQH